MPFYKFGEVVYLDKIGKTYLEAFIVDSFTKTGKKIEDEYAGKIVESVKCHPYYTQQLAHLVWVDTDVRVSCDIFNNAVDQLLSQNTLLYQTEIEMLTNMQVNFLKAVADGVEQLSTAGVIRKYKLNSSANVSRVKRALVKKEIIYTLNKKTTFIDPVFELWFKRYYSGKSTLS